MLRRKAKSRDADLLLFTYDARRGNSESTEREKILSFFPSVTNIDEQLSTVGLAQTFALFTGTFAGNSNFITLDTDKKKWTLLNVEPGIWIGMVVKNDWGPGKAGRGGCKLFLEEVYSYISLIHCSVQRLLDLDATARRARASLQGVTEIWGDLLSQKKSPEREKYENPLALRRLGAIPSLVVNRAAHLKLQTLAVAMKGLNFDSGCEIHEVMICYDTFLLWSGLDGKQTKQMYSFVEKSEMLMEAKGLERGATMVNLEEDGFTPYWLVPVYKSPLSIFVLSKTNPQKQIGFDSLDEAIQRDANLLIQSATTQLSLLKDYHIAGYRYASIDRLSRVGFASPSNKVRTLSDKTLGLLSRIQHRVDEEALAFEDISDFESIAKGENGCWIVTRRSGSKTLYVALDIIEDFSLEEVDTYLSRFTDRHFPGCFEV